MNFIFKLIILASFSNFIFAAEKDRGYCGRIIHSNELPNNSTQEPVHILAIECDSEVIDKKISTKSLINKSYIGFAIIADGETSLLDRYAKNKSSVCVRARWGSPGPCMGGSTYENIYTYTDSIHSIIYRSKETFPEKYYPYGESVR